MTSLFLKKKVHLKCSTHKVFGKNKKSPTGIGLKTNFTYLNYITKGLTMLAKLKSGIEVPYEELWLNDNDLAEFIGKSVDQTQRMLREMKRDRKYRKYVDKVGGRSTKVKKFEEWRKEKNEKII